MGRVEKNDIHRCKFRLKLMLLGSNSRIAEKQHGLEKVERVRWPEKFVYCLVFILMVEYHIPILEDVRRSVEYSLQDRAQRCWPIRKRLQ